MKNIVRRIRVLRERSLIINLAKSEGLIYDGSINVIEYCGKINISIKGNLKEVIFVEDFGS